MSEMSEESQTAEWLSRQLGRLIDHDSDRAPHNPAEYLEKQDRRMELLNRICVSQEALSNTQAALAAQRWRHTELLSRLGRARFELEARRRQFMLFFDDPDAVKIRSDCVSMPDPWDPELINLRSSFLADDEQQLLTQLVSFKETIEEDSKVRYEERSLRERADAHRRNAQRARVRQIETEKNAPLESYCSLRYRQTELKRLEDTSKIAIKGMTADSLAEVHRLVDSQRAQNDQIGRAKIVKKVNDAFALEQARLQEKFDVLESRISVMKTHSQSAKNDLVAQRDAARAELSAAEQERDGDDRVKKCKSLVKEITEKVRRLERVLGDAVDRVRLEREAKRQLQVRE